MGKCGRREELGPECEDGQGLPRPPSPKASCPGGVGNLAEGGECFCNLKGRKAQGAHRELKPSSSAPNLSSITLPAPHN